MTDLLPVLLLVGPPSLVMLTCRYLNRRGDDRSPAERRVPAPALAGWGHGPSL